MYIRHAVTKTNMAEFKRYERKQLKTIKKSDISMFFNVHKDKITLLSALQSSCLDALLHIHTITCTVK